MINEYSKHEKDYIEIYQEKGYTSNFYFREGTLFNSDTSEAYQPSNLHIVAQHRYEGMSNPEDLSILYVIETDSNEKGTMLLGYGPTADLELSEFFAAIPENQISNREDINAIMENAIKDHDKE
ncbi:hypothetical protein FFWV33_08725 [Flavobacterium faecale]|uniref:Uncharacterized protein n=1 Tax=Flavobacterium faecale TaxID=1355330 RepID=A0A2S1LD28_9FLAO|nr:hypothetical protein [Flavobacterium faecale]AWG21611.1 hypothetical protein FFWV33_08725 [Flavobacterium faecale]